MPARTQEQRTAHARYQRETWYPKNKAQHQTLIRQRVAALIDWLHRYKAMQVCKDCGEHDPACLDFHHRDPSDKEGNLANLIRRRGFGKMRLLREIAKCDVLCANCHRKVHRDMQAQEAVA